MRRIGVIAVIAIALAIGCSSTSTGTKPNDSDTIVTRVWDRDGTEGLEPLYLSRPATLPGGPHVPTVVGDSLRITSTATNTNGNVREIWPITDQEYSDVEVLVRIDEPSEIAGGGMMPQVGLALRITDDGDTGAFVNIHNNIAGSYGPLYAGVWTFDHASDGSSSIGIETQGQPDLMVRRAVIRGHQRVNIFGKWRDAFDLDVPPGFFAKGDKVEIDTGDSDYDRSSATILGYVIDYGWLVDSPAGTSSAKAWAADRGIMSIPAGDRYPADPRPTRRTYPAWLRARILGSRLQVKEWVDGAPEPGGWWTIDLSKEPDLPDKGRIGLVANHIWGAQKGGDPNYAAFGPVEITDLSHRAQ